jgi:phosphate-selective porin
LSLVETIVAGAIVAIAALLLVTFVLTLSGISQRSAEVSQADADLTMNIALNPENMTSTRSMSITIGGSTISTDQHSYHSNGRSLSTFELPTPPGAAP